MLLVHIADASFPILAKVHEVVTSTNQLLRNKVAAILRSMSLYLANEETEHILFRPIKVQPIQLIDFIDYQIKECLLCFTIPVYSAYSIIEFETQA